MDKRAWGVLLGVGLELAVLVVAATYLGEWIDRRYQLASWGTLGMVVLAFVGWLIHLLATLKSLEKSQEPPP